MKIFIILLTILNISAAHANEDLFFSSIPSSLTTDDAVAASSEDGPIVLTPEKNVPAGASVK